MPSPAIISRSSCRAAICADADLAELLEVEQGQALGEELAVDDALAKARNDPEADAAGKLVERRADAAKVVASICCRRLRSTTQSTLLPAFLARWVRLFQISSA